MNKATNKNVDYGKAFDKLRNPALIHKIQDVLVNIKGEGLLQQIVRNLAEENPAKAIELMHNCNTDNPRMAEEIVGKECIGWINEYFGICDINQQEMEDQ